MKLDFPSAYRSDRQRAAEERRNEQLAMDAVQKSEFLRRIREEEAEERAWGKVVFGLWCAADTRLRELEDARDSHAPKTVSDPWDETFCNAITEIHRVRKICDDLWWAYVNLGRDQFSMYI